VARGDVTRILAVVRRIPRGRVATYGQVAHLAGLPRGARQVGWALAALPASSSVPWQRVVNAQGRTSPRALPDAEALQRARLEAEGVRFDPHGRIDLARYGWRPRGASSAAPAAGGPGSRGRGGGHSRSPTRSDTRRT
jgi:methylated-DNA-protein-cysteine methyltransferase-like protein